MNTIQDFPISLSYPMKSSTKVLLIASIAGFLLVGCNNQQAAVDMNADGTMEVTTEQGTLTTGTDIPKDWPSDLPTYPGATVQFSGSGMPDAGGKMGWAMVLVTTDTAAKVKAYYVEELPKNGWTIVANLDSQGSIMMGATKGELAMSLTAGTQDGQTAITLGVGTKQ